MNTERKLEIIINMLPLIPLVTKGISDAVSTYNKMAKALKSGDISDDDMSLLVAETDDILDRIIDKTQE